MSFVMAMMAFVVELSRLMSNASELQSLTDASALAGVYGLVKVRDATYTTIADSTASLNKVEGLQVAHDRGLEEFVFDSYERMYASGCNRERVSIMLTTSDPASKRADQNRPAGSIPS